MTAVVTRANFRGFRSHHPQLESITGIEDLEDRSDYMEAHSSLDEQLVRAFGYMRCDPRLTSRSELGRLFFAASPKTEKVGLCSKAIV